MVKEFGTESAADVPESFRSVDGSKWEPTCGVVQEVEELPSMQDASSETVTASPRPRDEAVVSEPT